MALAALCGGGCSTPESRIRNDPVAFARPTSGQQDLIRRGQIAIGFDKEMVQLAPGEPDHVTNHIDATGPSEIWSYTAYESSDGEVLYRGWYHRYYY